MNINILKKLTLGAAVTASLGLTAHAQSADAILDKLVEKGILTSKEAQELRDESDKNFTTAMQTKNGMPDWVTSLKFSGDVRGRYEMFNSDNELFTNRERFRYRLRFGMVATMVDDFEAGFRLTSDDVASGGSNNEGDPISGNTTFQNNGSKKNIYIDQAYGKWSPLKGPNVLGSFTFGKMENPFVFSDLVFDADYTPEGLAAQFNYIVNDQHSLKLNAGYFVLDENSLSGSDPALAGAQVRWDAAWNAKFVTTMGVAYMTIADQSMLTNSAVPNVNRGNTRDFPSTAPTYDFTPVVVDAGATYTLASFPMYKGAFPIKVTGDYMNNPQAPQSAGNYGYDVGIQFGKSGKKGTWDMSYTWKYLGANSWYEELVDSDFGAFYASANSPANSGQGVGYGAGTNVKGHIIKFAYSPSDCFTLSVKWFLTSLIDDYGPGTSDMSRVQFDAAWKF